ncbi:MAG: hypothetical protein MJ188_00190 [Treponema sp.]|nr:hypothetical protein [Treponema sp.]
MDYLILGLSVVLIISFLLGVFWLWNGKNKVSSSTNQKASQKSKQKDHIPVKCPLCCTELFVGEQLISKVYRPMEVPDQLMTISGCPHCFPKCEPGVRRLCPVCHKEIGQDQTLTARLFNKSVGKKHVHIVGCSNCHRPRAD